MDGLANLSTEWFCLIIIPNISASFNLIVNNFNSNDGFHIITPGQGKI